MFLFFLGGGWGIDEGRYEFFESSFCWLHEDAGTKQRMYAVTKTKGVWVEFPLSFGETPAIFASSYLPTDGFVLEARRTVTSRPTRRGNSPNPPSARLWRNVKNAAGGSKTITDVYSTCGPNISVRHAQRGDDVNDGSRWHPTTRRGEKGSTDLKLAPAAVCSEQWGRVWLKNNNNSFVSRVE